MKPSIGLMQREQFLQKVLATESSQSQIQSQLDNSRVCGDLLDLTVANLQILGKMRDLLNPFWQETGIRRRGKTPWPEPSHCPLVVGPWQSGIPEPRAG
jgi:hypothetical protein